jgi:hypothetical protein
MAKRFFYTCAGILCLVLAYHLGATNATAQGEAKGRIRFIEAWGNHVCVVNDTDDIYVINPEKLRDIAKGAGWWRFRLDAVK